MSCVGRIFQAPDLYHTFFFFFFFFRLPLYYNILIIDLLQFEGIQHQVKMNGIGHISYSIL